MILDFVPRSLERHLNVFLFIRSEGRIQGAQGDRDPVGVFALVSGPEQRRTALPAKLAQYQLGGSIGLEALGTLDDAQITAQHTAITGERRPMAFPALAAMAVGKRFGAGRELVFDGAAQAAALEGVSHLRAPLETKGRPFKQSVLRMSNGCVWRIIAAR